MKYFIAAVLTTLLFGCATDPKDIQGQYVSPLAYNNYDCQQIGMEMERVSRRTSELGGQLQENADGDDAAMGIGLVLFWPALFFLDGDGPQAQEYGRLKGEFNTLEQVAVQKKCSVNVERPKLPEKPKQEAEEEA